MDRLIGFLTYDDTEFPFEFNFANQTLYLYPSQDLCKAKYNNFAYFLTEQKHEHDQVKWISEILIYGITSSQEHIVFSVEEKPRIYEGFLYFKVNWYLLLFDEIEKTNISAFSVEGTTVDSFYPPIIALDQRIEIDNSDRSRTYTVSTLPNPSYSCGQYVLKENIEISIEVKAEATTNIDNYRKPISAKSLFTTYFSTPTTIDTLIDAFKYTLQFFMYVTHRKNIDINKATVLSKNKEGVLEACGFLYFPQFDEAENNTEAFKKVIQYSDLKEKTAFIFKMIIDKNISLEYFASSFDSIRSYSLPRIIMLYSSFEHLFMSIYGESSAYSKEFYEVQCKVLQFLDQLIDEYKGKDKKKKEKAKSFKDINNKINPGGFSTYVSLALNDCSEIMEPFIKKYFRSNGTSDYKEIIDVISKRVCKMRNAIAHCRLDIEFAPDDLCDIVLMDFLLYAVLLKHIGLCTEECKEAISRLR